MTDPIDVRRVMPSLVLGKDDPLPSIETTRHLAQYRNVMPAEAVGDFMGVSPSIVPPEDIVYRLRKRAEIRRQIPTRKSVEEGKPDRIADLLDEAADAIETLRSTLE
jgi:hypothetical protein